jgi:hypothetical protein
MNTVVTSDVLPYSLTHRHQDFGTKILCPKNPKSHKYATFMFLNFLFNNNIKVSRLPKSEVGKKWNHSVKIIVL